MDTYNKLGATIAERAELSLKLEDYGGPDKVELASEVGDTDIDDVSSQSSDAFETSDIDEGTGNTPRSSSSNQTSKEAPRISPLDHLCSLPECHLNPRPVGLKDTSTGQASPHPKLSSVVEHIQSSETSTRQSDFIQSVRPVSESSSEPSKYLPSIAQHAHPSHATVTPHGPIRKHVPPKVEYHATSNVEAVRDALQRVIETCNKLQKPSVVNGKGSASSKTAPAHHDSRPCKRRASVYINTTTNPSSQFQQLRMFQRQLNTACVAILSQFQSCQHISKTTHEILLQLPNWDDVSDDQRAQLKVVKPARFFLTSCRDKDWNLVSVSLVSREETDECGSPNLCRAMNDAFTDDHDLTVYLWNESKLRRGLPVPIYRPHVQPRDRTYATTPKSEESLWELIKRGYFAHGPSAVQYCLRRRNDTPTAHQRKVLAAKLVLGLMLSLDEPHVLASWDPERVYFLNPVEPENIENPFVSISKHLDSSDPQRRLSPRLWPKDDNAEDWEFRRPFALLSWSLLQIADGGSLDRLDFSKKQAFDEAWRDLRQTLKQCVTWDGRHRDMLPIYLAAQSCLEIYNKYRDKRRNAQPSHLVEVVWRLMLDDVLGKFNVEEESMQPAQDAQPTRLSRSSTANQVTADSSPQYMRVIAVQSAQLSSNGVADSEEAKSADRFIGNLDIFHASYSHFFNKLVPASGEESPQQKRRIRIAILDTGVDFSHSGIRLGIKKGRIQESRCLGWADEKGGHDDEDDGLHGSNCAHLAHKAAPEADIYIAKVFKSTDIKLDEIPNISKAIQHAVQVWHVDIISMSFGLMPPARGADNDEDIDDAQALLNREEYERLYDELEDVIRDASGSCIMFAAASNSGRNVTSCTFPAIHPRVIGVYASDGLGEEAGLNPPPLPNKFNFMTLGKSVSLQERQVPSYGHVRESGTSYATPIAAGMAAIVLDLAAQVPDITTRTERKLRTSDHMPSALRLMAGSGQSSKQPFLYIAPWLLWKPWEGDEAKTRRVWDKINELFDL